MKWRWMDWVMVGGYAGIEWDDRITPAYNNLKRNGTVKACGI
ncbi:hypothetical protein [Aquiflexum sp.]